jgi:hydroxymethylpyrimidine pyrophosphatase-like HAD family hydrolase
MADALAADAAHDESRMSVRVLLARVEESVLTGGGVLTPATRRAAGRLRDADIALALTSARPPRGLRPLVETLGITAPVCGFDGGMLVRRDLSVLGQHVLGAAVAAAVIASMERHGLDVWVYQGDLWLVRRPDAAHVAQEAATVGFAPERVERWDGRAHEAVEIAGLSDDAAALARCEADLEALRAVASVARSRPRAIVVTHPRANTGELVRTLAAILGIPRGAVAAIGHAPSDVPMFRECGLAIAMGQGPATVQRRARFVTRSDESDGFAFAVDAWIVPNAGGVAPPPTMGEASPIGARRPRPQP